MELVRGNYLITRQLRDNLALLTLLHSRKPFGMGESGR